MRTVRRQVGEGPAGVLCHGRARLMVTQRSNDGLETAHLPYERFVAICQCISCGKGSKAAARADMRGNAPLARLLRARHACSDTATLISWRRIAPIIVSRPPKPAMDALLRSETWPGVATGPQSFIFHARAATNRPRPLGCSALGRRARRRRRSFRGGAARRRSARGRPDARWTPSALCRLLTSAAMRCSAAQENRYLHAPRARLPRARHACSATSALASCRCMLQRANDSRLTARL
jgi:hypothetical protein